MDFKTFLEKKKKKEKRLAKENEKLEMEILDFMNGRKPKSFDVKYIKQKTVETKNNGVCIFKTFILKKTKKKDIRFVEKFAEKIKSKYKPFWVYNDAFFISCIDNNKQMLIPGRWYTMKFYYNLKNNAMLLVEDIENY